jgi:cytochrome b
MPTVPASEIAQRPALRRILVWDPFLRLAHWLLVVTVLAALVTGLVFDATWLAVHVAAGTAAAAIVLARIVWGFLGPPTARFSEFVAGPRRFLHHLSELMSGSGRHHLGHNPAGGAMAVALSISGVAALGGSLKSGPLAFGTTFAVGEVFRSAHELIAYGLIGLILLHVGGALFESWRTRQNLVLAMIDGRKTAHPETVATTTMANPRLAIVISTIILGGAASLVFALSRLPASGAPSQTIDPTYVEECGACHNAFHPSLAPAAVWSSLLDGLADHFGEDATLDPQQANSIRTYLMANAAEAYDTKPAHRLRRRDSANPLSIVATPFWRRVHSTIPDKTFAMKAVGRRSNCNACHADAAAGSFSPFAIAIPQE